MQFLYLDLSLFQFALDISYLDDNRIWHNFDFAAFEMQDHLFDKLKIELISSIVYCHQGPIPHPLIVAKQASLISF